MGKFYLKAVLAAFVALFSLGGAMEASAQEDSYTEVYSRTASTWTDADKADWGGNSNLKIDAVNGLGASVNQSYSATKNFVISDNAKIKYEISWVVNAATGYDQNYNYLQIGSIRFSFSKYNGYLNSDGKSSRDNKIVSKLGKTDNNYSITIVYNSANKTIESLIFNGKDYLAQVSNPVEGDFKNVTFGYERGHSVNWGSNNFISSITVSQAKQAVTTADYTINYTLDGANVKTETSSSVVGATINADNVLTVDGVKYLVVADETPSITLSDGDNTLNVPVRKAYTATLNVTYNVGGAESTESTNLVETDDKTTNWSYAYPLYKKAEDGTYYKVDNSETFGESGTYKDGEVINKTVKYSTADADVVYFADASTTPGTQFQYSNGEDNYIAGQNKRDRGFSVGTLEAGTYAFTVNVTGANKRSVVIRHSTDDPLASTNGTGLQTMYFTLAEATSDLFINGANSGTARTNQSEDFDYVLVKKLASPTVSISSASSLASYSNSLAVTVPEGVSIFKASAPAEGSVTLTKVEGNVIPANTGVILYKENGGDITLTYGGTTTDDFSDNVLVATGNSDYTVNGDDVYALVKDQQAIAHVQSGVTIPANKAYLTYGGASAKLNINFGGVVTGINSIENATVNNDAPAYNLAGQRVSKSFKGVVIKNGKKLLQK